MAGAWRPATLEGGRSVGEGDEGHAGCVTASSTGADPAFAEWGYGNVSCRHVRAPVSNKERLMPIGYLVSTGLMATCTLFALRPPRPRRSSPFRVSFWFGFLVNELPFVAFYVLVAS